MRQAGEQGEARLRAAMAAITDPRDVVAAFAGALAHALVASGFTLGCPVAALAIEAGGNGGRLSDASRDSFGLWITALAEMLEGAGLAAGRANELADFTVAALEGALMLSRVRRTVAPLHAAAAEIVRVLNRDLPAKGTDSHA